VISRDSIRAMVITVSRGRSRGFLARAQQPVIDCPARTCSSLQAEPQMPVSIMSERGFLLIERVEGACALCRGGARVNSFVG